VVDAQALVLAERQVAVVPPAPALGRLLEQAEGVDQPLAAQRAEVGPLLGRAVDLAGPGHRVVDIAVFGRDVVVAHQHQARVARQFGGHEGLQCVQPGHLVGELLAARRLAVGKVGTDHPHAVHRGGNHPRLRVVEARQIAHHVQRLAA